MKNIHLIPTDKSSRLYSNNGQLHLDSILQNSSGHTINQHIYITNDEKPKKDYFISLNDDESYLEVTLNNKVDNFDDYADKDWTKNCKKVILTTDPDLIADGVQSIDDEFLQWFVKNPGCEKIEVEKKTLDISTLVSDYKKYPNLEVIDYKIIIPQEEPKQSSNFYEDLKKHFENTQKEKLLEEWEKSAKSDKVGPTVEEFLNNSKQETIKAAAENQWGNVHRTGVLGFIEGAKWMEERSYTEEEVKLLLDKVLIDHSDIVLADIPEWFENNKKK